MDRAWVGIDVARSFTGLSRAGHVGEGATLYRELENNEADFSTLKRKRGSLPAPPCRKRPGSWA
jgi:hypothetical protein